MVAYRTPADIGNRALQHCGASRMDPTLGFSEVSVNAAETSFAYDKDREAELMDRYWTFAIKRVVLRARDSSMMLLAPALWSPVTTYFYGSIVLDEQGSLWMSNIPNNLNNDPLLTTFWEPYCGPMGVPLYDSTVGYSSGELVYKTPGDGTNKVYLSLVDGNTDDPAIATAWNATVTYSKNQVVTVSSVAYMSLIDLNLNQAPASSPSAWSTVFVGGAGSVQWLEIGGSDFPAGVTLQTLNIAYPIGTGPSTQSTSRNVFVLPANYLRRAPIDPKRGVSWLGGPSGLAFDDWLIEGRFLTSRDTGPLMLRFVADITDVSRMPTQFCEVIAVRVAFAVVDKVTQSEAKRKLVGQIYAKWESEAGTIDGIEEGYEDAPDDDYLTVRL